MFAERQHKPLLLCREWLLGRGLILALFLAMIPALHAQLPSLEIGTSPNPVGSGARALGQGNAFIGVADDATAASWNPGGLTQLERPELSFALESIWRHESTQSGEHPESDNQGDLDLQAFNYASIVLPFHCKRPAVFSLNYLRLYSFDKQVRSPYSVTFPGGNADMLLDSAQDGSFSVVAPALAVSLTPRLSLGATLNIWNNDLTQSSSFRKEETIAGTLTIGGVPSAFRWDVEDEYVVEKGYSVVLGAFYRLSKAWSVGVVLKPPFSLDLDHKSSEVYQQEGAAPASDVSDEDGELEFPWIVGAGVAWRPRDEFVLSLDATWTDWSQYAYCENGEKTNPLTGEPVSEDELEDTWTLRLGAEYLLIFEKAIVPLRCGVGYDPAPGVDEIDDFYTFSVGTGLQAGRFMFDVAYEYRWGNDVNAAVMRGLGGTQDVRQHRLLMSLIVYF